MTRIVPALRGGSESRRGYLCITARAGIGKETGVESVDAVPIETPARLGVARAQVAACNSPPATSELQSSAAADIICKFVVGKKSELRTDTSSDANRNGLSVSR